MSSHPASSIFSALPTHCQDSYLPFLDEFRWKGSVDIVSKEGNRWDWFLNALENNRMRATVSHFPVFDTMDLDSKSSKNEIGAAENKRSLEKGKTIAAQSGEYEEAEDDGMEDAEGTTHKDESGSEICLETNSLCPGVEWNRQGPDMRYSPAFLLPLILGALESGLCTDNTETKEDAIDSLSTTRNGGIFSEFQYNSSFIHIAKRLCEKGALSLCLASLASRCEEVRGVAISCLGLLLRACTTGEARKLASWRERPQLAMLLNSVQRAFVLKQASNISSGYGSGLLTLSPIVSTFLARASFSVSKPDDALFEPLNRYFLKSDADHGAFQDMGRLPGFISLFCSSSEDSVQSRKERLWALQLLRDGFLDTTCYKLAASCHAPELILTSFENVRLSQCTDDMKGAECTLLLEVLKTLIDYGGSRAASHLVGRMGLLSWMRSLCIGTPLVESFPTIKSSINFCELLCSAVESASLNSRLRSDNLVHELCGLTEPVLILCLDRNDTKDRSPANCDMHGDSLLASAVCEALRSLRKALSRLKEEGLECSDVQSVGISLTEALRFLKLLPSDLFEQVTPLLSCLPLCLEHSSREEAAEFCSLLLQSCQNTQEDTAKTHSVLERVVLIIHHFGVGAADGDVLAMLLSLRSRFVLTTPGLLLWQKCLQQFLLASNNTLKGSPTDSIEVSVAKSFLLKNG